MFGFFHRFEENGDKMRKMAYEVQINGAPMTTIKFHSSKRNVYMKGLTNKK